jgi:predicted PurR-regulated permease PerM
VTAVLAVSVGLLSDPSWTSLVKVGGLYLVASTVENVVSPRIMGHSLSLHPVVVMLSLLIAGQFLGLVGLLVAVPAAAVIKESLKVWAPQLMQLLPLPRDAATSESEP